MQPQIQPKQDQRHPRYGRASLRRRCRTAVARQMRAWRRRAGVWRPLVGLCILCVAAGSSLIAAAAQEVVPSDATPTVTSVQPSEAQPGARVTLEIEGKDFASGAYVSFSDPGVHVLATRHLSDKRLEVDVAIGDKSQPESIRLYVANPSGTSGETSFAIVSGVPTAAKPAASATGLPAATPPSVSSAVSGTATGKSQAPSPGSSNTAQSIEEGASAPEVSMLDPEQVAAGSKASIKVKGKRFVKGTGVVFQNRGIRVLGTDFKKSTELVVRIEVAPDTATGRTNLFVVNPDESEAETSIEITAASLNATSNSPAATTETPASSSPSSQTTAAAPATNSGSKSFSVINLGDAINLLHNPNQPRGKLILTNGTLTYQEGGKNVFVATPGEVREVAPNIIFGINTGTFHIILSSGKSYNFVAASLMPSETSSIISALQQAVQ